MPRYTSEELLQQMARGDQTAFAELFDRHVSVVLRTSKRIVADKGAAEEVAQDTFLRAIERAHLFRGGNAAAWLLTIARHLSINCLRERATERRAVSNYEDSANAGPVLVSAQQNQRRLEVQSVLRELDPFQRSVLMLHYFNGLTYDQIAAVTGTTFESVKSAIQNGRIQFEKHWKLPAKGGQL